jgi:hypothetical protein
MTERMTTRTTALIAALLLVLGMAALGASTAGDGELSFVRAAEQSEPEQAKPNGTGNACPEASPQGADEDPACGTDGKGQDGDRGQSGEKGQNGDKGSQGEGTGNACPDASPNAGGEPPAATTAAGPSRTMRVRSTTRTGQCVGMNGTEPECDEGEVYDEDAGGCVEDGNGTEPECDEGEVYDEDAKECVADGNGVGSAACPEKAGFTLEVPAEPLAFACIALGPEEDPAAADDYCGEIKSGAFALEVPGEPLLYACVVLGPDEGEGNGNGEEEDEENGASLFLF